MVGIVVYYPEEPGPAHTALHVSKQVSKKRRGPRHSQGRDPFSEEFASSFYLFPPSPSLPPSFISWIRH